MFSVHSKYYPSSAFYRRGVRKVFLALSLFLLPVGLFADIIHLKNGEKIEGFFERTEGRYLLIRLKDGQVKKILKNRLQRVEIVYTGVSVCYRTKLRPTNKDCSGVLHTLTSSRVIIASADRKNKQIEFQLEQIKLLEFRKKNLNQKIAPLLRPGLRLQLLLKSDQIRGRIEKINRGLITVKLPDGNLRRIKEIELMGGIYIPPPIYKPVKKPIAPPVPVPLGDIGFHSRTDLNFKDPFEGYSRFRWKHLVPGLPQISRGDRLLGYGIIGGFGFLGAGFLMEYQAAQQVGAGASSDISFLLYGNPAFEAEFQAHQRNQKIIGGLALLLYAYHIYDSGIFGGFGGGANASLFRKAPPRVSLNSRYYQLGERNREDVNEIYFSFSF